MPRVFFAAVDSEAWDLAFEQLVYVFRADETEFAYANRQLFAVVAGIERFTCIFDGGDQVAGSFRSSSWVFAALGCDEGINSGQADGNILVFGHAAFLLRARLHTFLMVSRVVLFIRPSSVRVTPRFTKSSRESSSSSVNRL